MPLILTLWTSQCSKSNTSLCILPKYSPFHRYNSRSLKTRDYSSSTQPSRRKSRPQGRARSGGRIMLSLTNRYLHKCFRLLLSQWKVPNCQIRANLGQGTNRNCEGQEAWLRHQVPWNSLRMALISNLLTILLHGRMLLERVFMQRVSARQNRVRPFSASQARPLSFNLKSTRRTKWAKVSEGLKTLGIRLPTPQQRGDTWSESLRRGWSSIIRNLSLGNLIDLVWTKTALSSRVLIAPPGKRDSSSSRLPILLLLPKEQLLTNQARKAPSKRSSLSGRNLPIKRVSSKHCITTGLSHRRITCGEGTPLNKTSSNLPRKTKGLSSRMRTVLTLAQANNNIVHPSGTSPWNEAVPMWSNSSRRSPRSLNSLHRSSSQLLPSSLSS